MSLRSLLVCIAIILCEGTDNELVVEPANNIIVAAGTPVSMTCQVNADSDAGWRVLLWNSTKPKYFSVSRSQSIAVSRSQSIAVGLNISRPMPEVIKLQFLGTDQSVTAAQCQITGSDGNPIRSHIVNITIVDPPTAPTDVKAVLNGNILSVNWKAPPTISAGSINYTVTLATSKIPPVIVNDFSYNFTIDEDSCTSYYEVTITAINIAGKNSTTIRGYIPVIHNIYYEVFIQNNLIYFNAAFQVPHCIKFITTRFQLLILENDNNKIAPDVPTSSNCTPSISDTCISCMANLHSKSSFTFVIKHLNMTLSEPFEFNTNELQRAGVSNQVSVQTYRVNCLFLTGREVRGCRFILVGSGNNSNISGDIIRHSGNSASTLVNITRIGEYSTIVASLLGNNNDTCESCSYTSFPLYFKEALIPSKECMELIETTVPSSSKMATASLKNDNNQHLLIIICSTIGSVIFMFLVIVKVLVIYCYMQRKTMIGDKRFSTSIQDSSNSMYHTTNQIIKSNIRNHHTATDNECQLYATINDRETAIYHVLEREDKPEWNVQENEIYSEIKFTSSATNKPLSAESNVS